MLSLNDAGGIGFNRVIFLGIDRALAVNRFAKCIHHAADEALSDRDRNHTAGPLDHVPFFDPGIGAQNNDGNRLFFQVLCHAIGAIGELNQLTGYALVQPGDTCNAVSDQDHDTRFACLKPVLVILDLLTNELCYFFGS